MVKPVVLIFPMAGPAGQFGETFRPFLNIGEETFIERALKSFDRYQDHIAEVVFVVLQEHEQRYGISSRLNALFPFLRHRVAVLPEPTSGPAQTVRQALKALGITQDELIICDSDHYLNVAPLFARLSEQSPECVVPLWNLRGENINAWSIAALSDDGSIQGIAEKELPKSPGSFFGVIGCYYFRTPSHILASERSYISHILQDLIVAGKSVAGVRIAEAEFFGDPDRLRNALKIREKQKGVIFCDVDGTLIEHEAHPRYDVPLKVLPGAREKLIQWQAEGYSIILTSRRKHEDEQAFLAALKEAGLPFNRLLMGLAQGPRYLINDRKPSELLTSHAVAFEVKRNEGVKGVEIDSAQPNILKMFKGGSLSRTILVEKAGKLFVRKVVAKESSLGVKYHKLKRQFQDMKRLEKLCPEIVPASYGEGENSFEYFYDMEFLPDHDLLSNHSAVDKRRAVALLIKKMCAHVYRQQARLSPADGREWLLHHYKEKIYPKLESDHLPPNLASLVSNETVRIDGKQYDGLRRLLKRSLERPLVDALIPTYTCPIHGDLTFENVLYKGNSYNIESNAYEPSVKLVDTDCVDVLDPPELDLGKMFQSVVSQYDAWSLQRNPIISRGNGEDMRMLFQADEDLRRDTPEYISAWSQIIEGSQEGVETKGYFYMGLHLIRMIPFRLAVSEDQALFALASAVKALTYACERASAAESVVAARLVSFRSQPFAEMR